MSIQVPETDIVKVFPVFSCANSNLSIEIEDVATCIEYFPKPFFIMRGPLKIRGAITDPVKQVHYVLSGFNNEDEYEDVVTVIDEDTKKIRKRMIYRFLIQEIPYDPVTGEALERNPPTTKHSHMEFFEHTVTRPTDVELPPFAPGEEDSDMSSSSSDTPVIETELSTSGSEVTEMPFETVIEGTSDMGTPSDSDMPSTEIILTEMEASEIPHDTEYENTDDINTNL